MQGDEFLLCVNKRNTITYVIVATNFAKIFRKMRGVLKNVVLLHPLN